MADKVSNTAQDTVAKETTAEPINTKAEKPLVPFTQLWRFSTPGEKVLVVIGSILSLAYVCISGEGCQPVILLPFWSGLALAERLDNQAPDTAPRDAP